MKIAESHRCHGGVQLVLTHRAETLGAETTTGLFLPGGEGPFPVLWYLFGLTCTHENAMVKANLQLWASEAGLAEARVVEPLGLPLDQDVADVEDDGRDARPRAAHARCRAWKATWSAAKLETNQ
jgi:S-formylglutathione hydrolase